MRMPVTIRDERPADAERIAALVTDAFRGAPQSDGTEAALVDRLRRSGALVLSLVAEAENGDLVGHLGASPARLGDAGDWTAIAPVAVMAAYQRGGVGTALMRAALDRLRGRGGAGAVLVGDPGYYGRFGFAARPGLTAGAIPAAFVLALPFGDLAPQGDVRFHPAFGLD
jgi:putative acetyltransferase